MRAFKDYVFISDNPVSLNLDTRGRLHAEDAPAMMYADGYSLFHLSGTPVPKNFIETPRHEILAKDVLAIENTEQRRIAYELMDKTRMKELKDYQVLDEVKDDGQGYPMKIVSFKVKQFTEPLKYLNCSCPSTGREYFIETRQDKCWLAKNKSFGLEKINWLKEF